MRGRSGLARLKMPCIAPGHPDANSHGPTHALPKPAAVSPPYAKARFGFIVAARAGGEASQIVFASAPIPAPAVTGSTMPDASVNINAAAVARRDVPKHANLIAAASLRPQTATLK